MVQRLTYRRRLSYNTKSNKRRLVKTPGNRLVYHKRQKRAKPLRCAFSGQILSGIKPLRPAEKSRARRRRRTVSRPFGGVLSCKALQDKIIRAFLSEEMKQVKRYLKKMKEKETKK